MKYKVGDKVRIVNKRGELWNSAGEMDKRMGKILTVCRVHGGDGYFKDAGTRIIPYK